MELFRTVVLLCFLVAAPVFAENVDSGDARVTQAMQAARAHLAAHEAAVVQELRELLALPNFAGNQEDIRRNADALVGMLERRGVVARVLETPGAPVAVYGELAVPNATRTLLFYAHFDGSPVGPTDAWATPPFVPTLRGGRLEDGASKIPWERAEHPLDGNVRIYARSASDDKGPIVAMLAAIDALRAAEIPLSANLKFFLDGEEEVGSPNLARTLKLHRDLLASDLWIFGDGPIDPRGLPRVVLGVRGIIMFRITVFGSSTSLHSGHYGNVAPNPAARLAHLIASMRAPEGQILIDGMAPDAPHPEALVLAREAFDSAGTLSEVHLKESESGLDYGEAMLRPALNVTQLAYGGTGRQRNSIDPEATAGFDLRLTPGIKPEEARRLIETHVRAQGYTITDGPPTMEERRANARLAHIEWLDLGYGSAAAPLDHPGVRRVIEVMRAATEGDVRVAPLMGGSLPIAPVSEVLATPFVIVPIVNADNNQHGPNENLRMREFRRGIEFYAALLAAAGAAW